jgi:hypothetical protein
MDKILDKLIEIDQETSLMDVSYVDKSLLISIKKRLHELMDDVERAARLKNNQIEFSISLDSESNKEYIGFILIMIKDAINKMIYKRNAKVVMRDDRIFVIINSKTASLDVDTSYENITTRVLTEFMDRIKELEEV